MSKSIQHLWNSGPSSEKWFLTVRNVPFYMKRYCPRNKKWWGRASIDAGLLFLRDYLASMELPRST
jgi:hypothetical protein